MASAVLARKKGYQMTRCTDHFMQQTRGTARRCYSCGATSADRATRFEAALLSEFTPQGVALSNAAELQSDEAEAVFANAHDGLEAVYADEVACEEPPLTETELDA